MNAMTQKARPARFDPSLQHRRSMIAKVNIARQQLGMEEDDYRQLLFDETGQTSLRLCNDRQLAGLLDAFKRKGFRAIPSRKAVATHPMALKARALWISLYHLGAVHNSAEEALEAFAKRQLGCDKLIWARQSDGYRLIEALKKMGERAGWWQHNRATGRPLSVMELQTSLCHAILAKLKAAGAVPADWWIDVAAERLCGFAPMGDGGWTVEDYARLAASLGKKLRELGPAPGEVR